MNVATNMVNDATQMLSLFGYALMGLALVAGAIFHFATFIDPQYKSLGNKIMVGSLIAGLILAMAPNIPTWFQHFG